MYQLSDCFFSVGVKVLRDCGVQTVEVDTLSDPQGKHTIETFEHKITQSNTVIF